ncbi:CotO family spore coat protein [Ornithinibacillus xuwenensis]|uniref:CotO family spore coat protein n=1 Tax=Ornithinibacillus xuwenensis TaxID=3144668 RepID=A0ABU9XH89_9BACI
MSERSKFANEPLMYINQPTINKPSAPMQNFYTTPKKSLNHTPQTDEKTPQKKVKKRSSNLGAFSQVVPNLKEPQKVEKKHSTTNRLNSDKNEDSYAQSEEENNNERKKFKDMSLTEKIAYFVNTPNHLPKMRCEVKTAEKSHRGIIRDFKEDTVYMQVGRRSSNTTIKLEDITEIRLLGF